MPTAASPGKPTAEVPRLWVFDFDWTVVNENSDTWIHRCAPGGSLPTAVENSYVSPDWIGYMNLVLTFLAKQGVSAEKLRAKLQAIPWTPGMRTLLQAIADSAASSPPTIPSKTVASTLGPAASMIPSPATGGADETRQPPPGAPTSPPGVDTPAAQPGSCRSVTPVLAPAVAAALPDLTAIASPLAALADNELKLDQGWRPATAASDLSAAITFQGPQHAIILSDANSLFIPWILDADTAGSVPRRRGGKFDEGSSHTPDNVGQSLSFTFRHILTNPAMIDPSSGAIIVSPHHGVTPGSVAAPHACSRCHPNFCKRTALRRLLDEQATLGVSYRQIVYVGDGSNDLCPCLGLRSGDVVMPRADFALHKLLGPMAATTSPASLPVTTATLEAPDASGRGNSCTASAQTDLQGNTQVYVAGAPVLAVGHDCAAATDVGAENEERLRATCVPWVDAYDILRWVRQQELADEMLMSGCGLATHAEALAVTTI